MALNTAALGLIDGSTSETLTVATRTLTVSDLDSVIVADTTANAIAVTMPLATAVGAGGKFTIIANRPGANNVTAVLVGGNTFNGGQASPVTLGANNLSATLISDGVSDWRVIGL